MTPLSSLSNHLPEDVDRVVLAGRFIIDRDYLMACPFLYVFDEEKYKYKIHVRAVWDIIASTKRGKVVVVLSTTT